MSGTRKGTKKAFLVLVNILVIIGLAVFGGFYFKKYQDLKKNPPSPTVVAQQQTDELTTKVRKLYASLPTSEKPTIFEVTDKNAVKTQPFFEKAEKGDKALVYTNAKLAVLYRPSTNQIINVSAVSIQGNPVVKVFGAGRPAAEEKLTAAKITNSDGGEATVPVSSTVVVDLTGNNTTTAQSIASTLGGQVGQLPAGEAKPTGVDIAIYVP